MSKGVIKLKGNRWKVTAALLLSIVMVLVAILPGWAASLQSSKNKLNNVNKQIEQQKDKLQQNNAQQKNVLQDLTQIDQDITKAQQELESLNADLQQVQGQLAATQKNLDQAQTDLDKRSAILGERLRDIYTQGRVSYLEVLFQSSSFSDFLTRFDMLQRIAEQDNSLVEQLAAERDKIASEKKQLVSQRARLSALRESTAAKQNYLASRSSDKKQMLGQLNSQKETYEQALDELETTSNQLATLIRQLQSGGEPAQKGTGRFIWPVNGPITSPFGRRYHPILHTYKTHTGIDIGVKSGTPIKAADSGTVIYTGWVNGYGNVVIINHGGGLSTMYCHQSKIKAHTGQNVSQGEVIGYVGSTGLSTGPHLHFEVRLNGNPVNPMNYL